MKSPYQEGKQHSWGEKIYAHSLADAFSNIGLPARVDDHNEWSSKSNADEAAVLIRGKLKYPYEAKRGSASWLISEMIQSEVSKEADNHTANFFASRLFFEGIKVRPQDSVLFQATDHRIFYPGERDYDGPTLFVGNNYRRWEVRPVIQKALTEDLPVDVYGDRWDRKLNADRLRAASISNLQLGELYRSAGVVLNDHRPTMLENGLISNRIFDVLACAVPLISDRIKGLPEGFEEFIYMFDEDTPLTDLITQAKTESAAKRRKRTDFAQHVVQEYSFLAAAKTIAASLGLSRKA
ncbi:glycosyltransferase family protein [Ruegeria atlantica]|uniref:glycosyltransferase family protein n=1 Tax=Ruegeria atlantica TaxID=81569 RepID=UPI002493DEB6|nr:glycosyltransferase [Ruegeria atlantica]